MERLKHNILTTRFLFGALLVALMVTGIVLFHHSQWLEMSENIYVDLWHQLAGVRYIPQHVVIVAIDDQTLLEHPDEPMVFWGPYFAKAIDVLRKYNAKIIGLDIIFSVSVESWLNRLGWSGVNEKSRTHDSPLREQLASGRVVMAGNVVFDEHGKRRVLLPSWDLWLSLKQKLNGIGLTNFYLDPDGVIRKSTAVYSDENRKVLGPTFGWLLAEQFAGRNPSINGRDIFPIVYAGPPGTFPRVPFRLLLRPQAENDPALADTVKDKVVIIAYEASDLQDTRMTPYARSFLNFNSRMMSGAEVHANIVETLLTGRFLESVPPIMRIFYLTLIFAAGTALFFKISPVSGIFILFILSIFCGLLAYLAFQFNFIIPVASVQLGLVACYLGTVGIRLTGEEKERRRLRHIFGRYVHDEVVEKLLATGNQPDRGEELLVTILFLDIRNFTKISEKLNPRESVGLLNAYFAQACEPILANEGIVDKFIGDGFMAIFGSPIFNPDHARLAIKTALALAEKAKDFHHHLPQRLKDMGLDDFQIGIGLHTGPAVVGLIGSSKRYEFTAIGDTVNTASRLEQATKELGWPIVASRATIQAAGSSVLTGRKKEITLKGKNNKIEVIEVLGLGEAIKFD